MANYTWNFDARRAGFPSPLVRVQLEGESRSCLGLVEGIRGGLARPVDPLQRPDFEVLATLQGAWVRAGNEGAWLHVCSPRDATGHVTAWTLPILGEGAVTGFDPADLAPLLASTEAAFENLPWAWRPPLERHLAERVADVTGAYVVFVVGEDFELQGVNERVERLHRLLPDSAHCLFATCVVPGHGARMLLTLFRGGPRDVNNLHSPPPRRGSRGGCAGSET